MPHILVADDDATTRQMVGGVLKKNGYKVSTASDGVSALRAMQKKEFDLVLLDIWMPILNGLEVLEHLGRAAQGVGLKVVVLSHQGDSDTRLEGFALGVVDYWTKDLSLAELSARIESVLGSPSPATESAVND